MLSAMGRWFSSESVSTAGLAPERDFPGPSPQVVQERLRGGFFCAKCSPNATADGLPAVPGDGSGQTGDSTLEGNEEALVYYSDRASSTRNATIGSSPSG